MVGNHSIYSVYTLGIIENYDKQYSDKIKLNENIVTLLISELENELRELELPEKVKVNMQMLLLIKTLWILFHICYL